MLLVVSIIGIMIGVAFPSVTAGLDSLRLRSASEEIASAFNAAMNRADRRLMAVEVVVDRGANRILFASADNSYRRELAMPDGVRIDRVYPLIPNLDESLPRQFLIHPGGPVPRIGIEIRNLRNTRRIVTVDPISGRPQVTGGGE
jgi:hypothetical protein